MNLKGIHNKKGTLVGISITYINKEGILKRNNLSLRKIIVSGLIASGILTSAIVGIKNINTDTTITNPNEIEIDADEEFIKESLESYYNTREAYNKGEIDAREFVEETRELRNDTLTLMKEKVKDELELSDDHKVYIEQTTDTRNGPINTITVCDSNGKEIYVSNEFPDELEGTFGAIIATDFYKGTGENWTKKDVKKFMKVGDNLYNATEELLQVDDIEMGESLIENENHKTI